MTLPSPAGRLALGLVLLGLSLHGQAAALRCGTRLIAEQASMADVLARCGQPARQEGREPPPRPAGARAWHPASINLWVYGPHNGAYHYLRFVDGKLVEIRMRREAPGATLFPG